MFNKMGPIWTMPGHTDDLFMEGITAMIPAIREIISKAREAVPPPMGNLRRRLQDAEEVVNRIDLQDTEEILGNGDLASQNYNDLYLTMEELAPPLAFFGTLYGYPYEYGYWPDWDRIRIMEDELLHGPEFMEDEIESRKKAGVGPNWMLVTMESGSNGRTGGVLYDVREETPVLIWSLRY